MDAEAILQEWFKSVSSAPDCSQALAKLAEMNTVGQRELVDATVEVFGVDPIRSIASLVVGQISYLQSLNLESDEFYRRLWGLLSESVLFDTDETKMQALGIAVTSPGMPYRQADVVTMSDEEYAARQQALTSQIQDMIDMLNRKFSQKTETASAVLNIIEECDDRADRAVMMSVLLESARNASVSLITPR